MFQAGRRLSISRLVIPLQVPHRSKGRLVAPRGSLWTLIYLPEPAGGNLLMSSASDPCFPTGMLAAGRVKVA